MSIKTVVGALMGTTLLLGCASGFSRITPGMTSFQVTEVMGHGPSRALEFRDGSVAWFYGADRCVRLRDDVVVGKEVTEYEHGLSTPWVNMSQERPAQCAPPEERVETMRTNVHTPIGVFTTQHDASKKPVAEPQHVADPQPAEVTEPPLP